jgi:hypothetical protein
MADTGMNSKGWNWSYIPVRKERKGHRDRKFSWSGGGWEGGGVTSD